MKKEPKALLIVGLGFGDEGKGSSVDYLTRKTGTHTVVRYNGGAQAAHAVVATDGRSHVFAQFGSGTLVPQVKTHLSRFMVLNPITMIFEEKHLRGVGIEDAFDRVTVDEEALVSTLFQKTANRIRELVLQSDRLGSCGMGIGETIQDFQEYGRQIVQARDIKDPQVLRRKLRFIQALKKAKTDGMINGAPLTLVNNPVLKAELALLESSEVIEKQIDYYRYFASRVKIVDGQYLEKLFSRDRTVVFEGAQGILLDRQFGFYPYITKSDTTFGNAYALLKEANFEGNIECFGVLRGYFTRHGPGPFVTEDEALKDLTDEHNIHNEWQGTLRIGYFDLVASQYALECVGKIDGIILTNLDRMMRLPIIRLGIAYEIDGGEQFFRSKNGLAREIILQRPPTKEHQGALTEKLKRVKPVYEDRPAIDSKKKALDYAELIGQKLGVKIKIVSFGPTAKQKQELC